MSNGASGGRGWSEKSYLPCTVRVAVGEHGEGRERGQRGRLLFWGQPGQVLGEVQAVPADDGVHQQALAGLGHQLLGAGGSVKLLVAAVPDGVGEPVGALALVELFWMRWRSSTWST